MRKLAGGYVAWGTYSKSLNPAADPPFTTWFSTDGASWERTVHSKSIVPCPGWTARPDIDSVYEPTSDGRTLVFTATYLLPDADACDRAWMISLSTSDGRTWSRSAPFGPPHDDPAWGIWAESSWAIPGGWETLVSTGGDVGTIWRTTDSATWTQVASRPMDRENGPDFHFLGAAPDGTRLGVSRRTLDDPVQSVLEASSDGIDWKTVRALPKGFFVAGVVPPAELGDPWLVAIEREDPEEARVLATTDLADWTRTTMPKPGIRGLTDATSGWVMVGLWPGRDTGCYESCRPERPSLYTSTDGLTWVNHPRSMPPQPAQVLGSVGNGEVIAGDYPRKGVVTLWRLADWH